METPDRADLFVEHFIQSITMHPIVAIIGRPNVGKSTLFNRIVGLREAIVHDEPGVTRDRKYGMAEWAGKSFTLIDTGGYVPKSEDVFERAIREQAEIAIEEAAAVIFLVDAIAGIVPLDEDIGGILRRANKCVHLVANKVDSAARENEAAQFYKLGLGEPIPLGALGGRGIGDFLDELVRDFGVEQGDGGTEDQIKIAIVGKPNVGKSTLVNALLGKKRNIVTEFPGTTRDSIDSLLEHEGKEYLLIDTAGLRRRSRIQESIEFFSTLRTLKSIDRCNVAVQVLDAEQGMDKQDLRIVEDICQRRRGLILAVNKWDLIEKDEKTSLHFETAIRKFLRRYDYLPVLFISALKKQRIFRMLELAQEVYGELNKRVPTRRLNEVLQREIEHHPPSSATGREIKIKYVTQVKTNPPLISFFANEPAMIKSDYKRFLESKIRDHFGFKGVSISLVFRKKNK